MVWSMDMFPPLANQHLYNICTAMCYLKWINKTVQFVWSGVEINGSSLETYLLSKIAIFWPKLSFNSDPEHLNCKKKNIFPVKLRPPLTAFSSSHLGFAKTDSFNNVNVNKGLSCNRMHVRVFLNASVRALEELKVSAQIGDFSSNVSIA